MQSLQVLYGQKIGILSVANSKFISYAQQNEEETQQEQYQLTLQNSQFNLQKNIPISQQINCNGIHPINKNKVQKENRETDEEFVIINAQNQGYLKKPVKYGNQVFLVNSDNYYLQNLSDGTLVMTKPKFNEGPESQLFKNARWSIKDFNNESNKSEVLVQQEIILQSMYGHYLQLDQETGQLNGNGKDINIRTSFKICHSNIPFIPSWVYQRPLQPLNFQFQQYQQQVLQDSKIGNNLNISNISNKTNEFYQNQNVLVKKETHQLQNLPAQQQEFNLIEELMFAMMSIEGTYIKKKYDQLDPQLYDYVLDQNLQCESSLRQMVNKILPICTMYDRIQQFTNVQKGFEYGSVSQALCAAIDYLLQEYILMINQIDLEFQKGVLSLQKLWYYMQPTLKTIENLEKLTQICKNCKGSVLLGKIFQLQSNSIDPDMNTIYYYLLQKSFQPYLKIFSKWIFHGIIDDSYEEFIVYELNENSNTNNDDWQRRFNLKQDIPKFLQKYADLILKTGKYINVLRECDKENSIQCPYERMLFENQDLYIQKQDFSEAILKAHDWANQKIIDLTKIQEFKQRIASIKSYFFMEKGDFFEEFFETSKDELKQKVSSINKQKIQSLLEMSLRTSSLQNSKYIEDMECYLESFTLSEYLKTFKNCYEKNNNLHNKNILNKENTMKRTHGSEIRVFESFTLYYKISWPLNLIITNKNQNQYIILFKNLFQSKYAEKQLNNLWLQLQKLKYNKTKAIFYSCNLLLQRMLLYIKNYIQNLCFEVFEKNWQIFMQKLEKIQIFEDYRTYHNEFLDNCMKECKITDEEWFGITQSLTSFCRIFTELMSDYILKLEKTISVKMARFGEETIIDAQFDNVSGVGSKKSGIQKQKEDPSAVIFNQMQQDRERKQQIENIIEEDIRKLSFKGLTDAFLDKFDKTLKQLFDYLNRSVTKEDNAQLNNLVSRLDYDQYYRRYLDMDMIQPYNQQQTYTQPQQNINNNNMELEQQQQKQQQYQLQKQQQQQLLLQQQQLQNKQQFMNQNI